MASSNKLIIGKVVIYPHTKNLLYMLSLRCLVQSSLDNFNVPDRNAKHRLVPSVSLAGSLVAAFDDVSVEDPDFGSIQGKD